MNLSTYRLMAWSSFFILSAHIIPETEAKTILLTAALVLIGIGVSIKNETKD